MALRQGPFFDLGLGNPTLHLLRLLGRAEADDCAAVLCTATPRIRLALAFACDPAVRRLDLHHVHSAPRTFTSNERLVRQATEPRGEGIGLARRHAQRFLRNAWMRERDWKPI